MTRDLPHVGLGGPQRSMYGDRSTIGEADLLGLRDAIRVTASVGQAIPELTSDA